MSAVKSRFMRMSALADNGTEKDFAMDVWGSDDDSDLYEPPADFESGSGKLSNLPADPETDNGELSDPPANLGGDGGKSNLPADLERDDGKPKTAKRKGRAINFQFKQVDIDADSGEQYEVRQSDVDEGSGDEWNPSGGGASSKTRKPTHNYTKKNALKTKKALRTAPVTCTWPGCGAHLARIDHLRRHIAAHISPDGKPFRCPTAFCGFAAKRRDSLAAHLKLRHKLSAAAARKSAASAAEAANDEIRSLARAVEAAIKVAASDSDTELDQVVTAGSKRKNKDRGHATIHGKKRAHVSNGSGATENGEGQTHAVVQEDEEHIAAMNIGKKNARILRSTVAKANATDEKGLQSEETEHGTVIHAADPIDGSDPGDDGPGMLLLEDAYDADDDDA
ncbi:hypothetical protein PSPO01_12291 [Paraphaeosphaeria sporulosa]